MNPTDCVYPDCPKVRQTRGLCFSHSASAVRLIRNGQATERDLMERGLMLKKHQKRGKVKALHCGYLLEGSMVRGKER